MAALPSVANVVVELADGEVLRAQSTAGVIPVGAVGAHLGDTDQPESEFELGFCHGWQSILLSHGFVLMDISLSAG